MACMRDLGFRDFQQPNDPQKAEIKASLFPRMNMHILIC